jgi:hypothetical protein
MCYGDVINKAKKFKSDTSKLVKSLKNLIHKGYDLSTIVYALSHAYCCVYSREHITPAEAQLGQLA